MRGVHVQLVLPSVSLSGQEHFGFADGLTNPFTAALHEAGLAEDSLPPGEFVLGYPNLSGFVPPGPAVPLADAPQLPVCPTDTRQADFGRNSTYIVFRQIEQDVREFWDRHRPRRRGGRPRTVRRSRRGLEADRTPARRHTASDCIGSNGGCAPAVGRSCSPTIPRAALPGRRTSGAPTHATRSSRSRPNRWRHVRLHRLLRRGRAYGAPAPAEWYPPGVQVKADDEVPGGEERGRGLYFVCVCADIERQFEFVQQTWMSNQKFGGLFNSTDPLSSGRNPDGRFTIAQTPVRVRLSGFSPATRTVGGAYLILPSRSALQYLAEALRGKGRAFEGAMRFNNVSILGSLTSTRRTG